MAINIEGTNAKDKNACLKVSHCRANASLETPNLYFLTFVGKTPDLVCLILKEFSVSLFSSLFLSHLLVASHANGKNILSNLPAKTQGNSPLNM